MISRKISGWGFVRLLLLLTLFLAGCSGGTREGCEPEADTPENEAGSPVADSLITATPQDPEIVRDIWNAGPHADTFIVSEDNTNSACANCHAPLHWLPTAEDIPANWIENQLEPEPKRLFISELDWTHVDCKVCHSTEEDQTAGDIAWLEIAPLETYSELETSTQLCQKCHLENNHTGHQPLMLVGIHADFFCTDCHDAHDTTATCSSSTCHEPFANECESIETHDKPHTEVTCSACHDGGEPEIKWNEELLAWDTYRKIEGANPEEHEPYVSHNILLEVDCDRCHAPGDHPWDP